MIGRARPSLPRWLPLYLLALLVAGWSPLALHCAPLPVQTKPAPVDAILNFAAFLPLGIALRRLHLHWATGFALIIAILMEAPQMWMPRHPNVSDVAANVAGAVLAHRLSQRFRPRIPCPPPVVLAIACGSLGALGIVASFVLARHVRPNDFRNWSDYPLVIGNEFHAERPWEGLLQEIAVFDRTVSDEEAFRPRGSRRWARGEPALWMSFGRPAEGWVDDDGVQRMLPAAPPPDERFVVEERGLRARGGRWVLPHWAAGALRRRLVATGRLSVWARFVPEPRPARQQGRIITLSWDGSHRNFTLGTKAQDLVFRVRTPATGRNGSRPQALTQRSPLGGGPASVLAVFDGSRYRILVDGSCVFDRHLARNRQPGPLGEGIAGTVVAVTALAGIAAGLLARGAARPVWATAIAAGAAIAWGLLLASRSWDHHPGFTPKAAVLCAATTAGVVWWLSGGRSGTRGRGGRDADQGTPATFCSTTTGAEVTG